MKHNESFDVGGWLGGWFQTQDDVETKLYGLRPFEAHGAPRNNSEAAERSMCAARTSTTHAPRTRHILRRGGRTRIYICTPYNICAPRGRYALLNLAGADGGSPLYGDISAVLSPRHVRSVTLLSAIDTGEWTALCNQTRGNTAEGIAAWREGTAPLPGVPWHGARREGVGWTPNPPPGWTPSSNYTPYAPVCDAYHFTLGTLDHFDHLILANLHCAPAQTTLMPRTHARTTAATLVCRQGALRPAPCTLRPAPCALHPAPRTPRPAPCTLHLTLHPYTHA